ncbi:hypothetical protein BKA81DRAFT_160624 [Phyllosticta paracitricarpa]
MDGGWLQRIDGVNFAAWARAAGANQRAEKDEMGNIQAPVVNGRSYSYAGPLLACICTWPDSPAATSGQARDHAWSPDSLRGPRRWFGGDTESMNEGCSHPALQPSRVTTNPLLLLLLMMRLGLAKGCMWQGRFARSTGAVGRGRGTHPTPPHCH